MYNFLTDKLNQSGAGHFTSKCKRFFFCLLLLIPSHYLSAGILIVAPHPDDEVIIAGGVIYHATQQQQEVTIAYITNGDKYGLELGRIRQLEAIKGTRHLGLAENNLVFLGYPDGYLKTLFEEYNDIKSRFETPNGQSVTYASNGLGNTDYHQFWAGKPALYNAPNLISDIQQLLKKLKPEAIFTVSEYDIHPDHNTTYKALLTALGKLQETTPQYRPSVYRTMVHTPDRANWPTPTAPSSFHTIPPGLDQTSLNWNKRVSLNVPLEMQNNQLDSNPKYKAINAHKSQHGSNSFIGQFIHKDEIFWVNTPSEGNQPPIVNAGLDKYAEAGQTITLDGSQSSDPDGDKLSYQWRQVSGHSVIINDNRSVKPAITLPITQANSQALTFALKVNDGEFNSIEDSVSVYIKNKSDIIASLMIDRKDLQMDRLQRFSNDIIQTLLTWREHPDKKRIPPGQQNTVAINLPSEFLIDRVKIYDSIELNNHITKGLLEFSHGNSIIVGELNNNGQPITIEFPQVRTDYIKFRSAEASWSTTSPTISKIEIFGARNTE